MSVSLKDISQDLISGIYNVLEGITVDRVDTITLTGSSGSAIITNNYLSKTITYVTSLQNTAAQFVADNYVAYNAIGSVISASGDTLTFRPLIEGSVFAGPTTITSTVSDWFLPSHEELKAMYDELHSYGLGGFTAGDYWSSTEANALNANYVNFATGSWALNGGKNNLRNVRACRSFTTATVYALRDTGPAGGLIFSAIDNGDGTFTYLEAASEDQSNSQYWSNVTDVEIGTTSIYVGEGQDNTNEIISQSGHLVSAASLCDTLSWSGTAVLGGAITSEGISYPVYKSVPKNAPQVYVYVGGVIQTEDGTKDEFHYYGTVQIQVVDESRERADLKLAQDILNITRGMLKPTKEAVFPTGDKDLVIFKHESFNSMVTQSDSGISSIRLVDIYNYVIN